MSIRNRIAPILAIAVTASLFNAEIGAAVDSLPGPAQSTVLQSATRLNVPRAFPVGEEPIGATDYRPQDHLRQGLEIPESTAHEPSGNFQLICTFSHFAYDDPIVAPGRPGQSHLHTFFGNTGADANSTYESLRTTGESTCQGGPLNRSAYWMPTVIDGSGRAVVPDLISVYYTGRGRNTAGQWVDVAELVPGLRMIAGSIPGAANTDSRHRWFCGTNQVKARTIPSSCDADEEVLVTLDFPDCWDGRHLDVADHRSHVAYQRYHPTTGQPYCPSTHPVAIPKFTLNVYFSHEGDTSDWHLVSDRMANTRQHPDGESFHADWFGAWDPDALSTWTSRCINGQLNCEWGNLGDGTGLSINENYDGPKRVRVPTRPGG